MTIRRDTLQRLSGFDTDEFEANVDVSGNLRIRNLVWNADTLTWEAATSHTGLGTEVEVTNFPSSQAVSGPLTDAQLRNTAVPTEGSSYSLRLDDAADPVLYIGEAVIGGLENASIWRIKQVDTTTGIIIKWAGGVGTFTHRWDQRLILSYS